MTKQQTLLKIDFAQAVMEAKEYMETHDMWSKKRLAAMGVIYTHLNGTFTLAPIGLTAMKETTRSKQKRKYARSPIFRKYHAETYKKWKKNNPEQYKKLYRKHNKQRKELSLLGVKLN